MRTQTVGLIESWYVSVTPMWSAAVESSHRGQYRPRQHYQSHRCGSKANDARGLEAERRAAMHAKHLLILHIGTVDAQGYVQLQFAPKTTMMPGPCR